MRQQIRKNVYVVCNTISGVHAIRRLTLKVCNVFMAPSGKVSGRCLIARITVVAVERQGCVEKAICFSCSVCSYATIGSSFQIRLLRANSWIYDPCGVSFVGDYRVSGSSNVRPASKVLTLVGPFSLIRAAEVRVDVISGAFNSG